VKPASDETEHTSNEIFSMGIPHIYEDKTACATLGYNFEAPKGVDRSTILAGEIYPRLEDFEVY